MFVTFGPMLKADSSEAGEGWSDSQAKTSGTTCYPNSSCTMGPQVSAVADGELRVKKAPRSE